MSRGPLPSQLCLLSELPAKEVGSKVRFLACVVAYSTDSARLDLRHAHPAGAEPVIARVDVNLLLAHLTQEQTAVGNWVNVIGYVKSKSRRRPSASTAAGDARARAHVSVVHVQAITLWSAGSLDVQRYEKAVPVKSVNASVKGAPREARPATNPYEKTRRGEA